MIRFPHLRFSSMRCLHSLKHAQVTTSLRPTSSAIRPIVSQHRLKCSSSSNKNDTVQAMSSSIFWSSRPLWRRAGVNTLRCLVGCTLGDFSSMWYLQAFHPDMAVGSIMAVSMACGVTTSLLLETTLLRYGRDRLPWVPAARTAAGMSMISMLTMELAQNTVDYHLTGGVVELDSPSFWAAAVVSVVAGFLAPLPYNYVRLRKYGRSCH